MKISNINWKGSGIIYKIIALFIKNDADINLFCSVNEI